jgi:hypothetical protein
MQSTKILLALTLLSAPLHADPRVTSRRPAQRAAQQPPHDPPTATRAPATAPHRATAATAAQGDRQPATNAAACDPHAAAARDRARDRTSHQTPPRSEVAAAVSRPSTTARPTSSADFVQVSRNRLYGEERRTGQVLFRKPGRMRWNYAAPSGDVIVSDGTHPLGLPGRRAPGRAAAASRQSQLPTALTFLAGTGRHHRRVHLPPARRGPVPLPQSGHVLELRPTTPQPSYERIVFYVDRATYQVVPAPPSSTPRAIRTASTSATPG